MSLTTKEIKEILAILEASGWDEAEVRVGDVTVTVSKNGAGPGAQPPAGAPVAPVGPSGATTPATPPAAPAPPAASPPTAVTLAPAGGHTVSSSSVGVFWRAPQPGAPPFVEEGAHVEAGAQLGIVEVMKLMTPVHADVAGTVAAIHTGNGERVECGTPLVTIAPD